jgi:Transposase DDE domain/Transposase domain (DUF772)
MRWKPPKENDRERAVAGQLRASSRFYRFLWEVRRELFDDGFEEALIESYQPRGQDPCPPAMLAMVLLLQRYEGLSDAAAVDAAENDRRWQLVLGTLGRDKAPFGQGSLVRFRTRMIGHDLDRKLVDRTVELAKRTGKFGWKKLRVALDSSPLEGAGRVEDTWNLIGRAMTKVLHAISMALQIDESQVIRDAKLTVLEGESVKAALDIDWDNEDAQRSALKRLLDEVSRLEAWVERRAKKEAGEPPLKEALTLLRRVVDQDTEPEPPGGRPRIKEGVAADRVISIGDPEMRHGRKSKTERIDGYKRHVAIANGLILGTAVQPANVMEHLAAAKLLSAAERHGQIATLDIDRGYLPSPAVEQLHRDGVTIQSRPWRLNSYSGLFTKDDFSIDLRRRRVVCPAGKIARVLSSGAAWFSPDDCGSCSLKSQCTSGKHRSVQIHRQEDLLLQLRRRRRTRTGRAELRKRVAVEHRLARIGAIQGSRARYCGVRKNELDLNRAAAVANLHVLAGLRRAA